MRRAVDSAREPRHDHRPLLPEVVGELTREAARGGGRVASTDHGDHRLVEQLAIALHRQQRRGIVHLGQRRRIKSLPEDQVAGAERFDPRNLPLRLGTRDQARRPTAASGREIRNRIQGGRRRAEAGD